MAIVRRSEAPSASANARADRNALGQRGLRAQGARTAVVSANTVPFGRLFEARLRSVFNTKNAAIAQDAGTSRPVAPTGQPMALAWGGRPAILIRPDELEPSDE